MVDILHRRLEGKKILLLGFGREGESSYREIRRMWPRKKIWIADANPEVKNNPLLIQDPYLGFSCGENYLDNLNQFDLILRSPGISLQNINVPEERSRITSQTDLFLEAFAQQVTGITGTKGKSTTSSLIAHILKLDGRDTILLGNIGTPAWHFLEAITPETVIVDELSSHQLEYIHRGPHIALLLNIFEEHLDAYASFHDYQLAKMKIATTQKADDFLFYNADDPLITHHLQVEPPVIARSKATKQPPVIARSKATKQPLVIARSKATKQPLVIARSKATKQPPVIARSKATKQPPPATHIPISLTQHLTTGAFKQNNELVIRVPGRNELRIKQFHNRYLKGEHNHCNILFAAATCWFYGVSEEAILDGLASFKGLAHRMELLGTYHDIHWVNDSIATVPEACIAALKALPEVDTIILGGFDRGLSYELLGRFLAENPVRTLIFVGAAGRRIGNELEKADKTIKTRKKLFYINRFDQFLPLALEHTKPGSTCLLSPAASSYDEFRSFEERGFRFRELVMEATPD